jgi:hypothetical protein
MTALCQPWACKLQAIGLRRGFKSPRLHQIRNTNQALSVYRKCFFCALLGGLGFSRSGVEW